MKYTRVGHNWQVLIRAGGCGGELCGRRSETALCWSQPLPAGSTMDKTDDTQPMTHVSTQPIREARDTSVKMCLRKGGHCYGEDAEGEIQEET